MQRDINPVSLESDDDDEDRDNERRVQLIPNMPAPVVLTASQVRARAAKRSQKLCASYETLRSILDRHEATIQNRWLKKKKQQKLKILLEAWPDMPAVHRPDFKAFRRESLVQAKLATTFTTNFRDHYLWPYINQEDLLRGKTLLLMLNSRGRNFPSHFAGSDREAFHLGHIVTAIVPCFLNEHVMMLNGIEIPEKYGELLSWDDHPDAFDWMHKQKQFNPGEGLLILEVQERILAFLVDCSKQILHDLPQDALTSDIYPIQPEPQLKSESESSGFESMTVMTAEAPYRLPQKLDLRRIVAVLSAKVAAAEDHLWSLREDPAYFNEFIIEYKEHRQEMLLDTVGKKHPILTPSHEHIFWARVVHWVVLVSSTEVDLFSTLHRKAVELQSLEEEHRARIAPSEDLPEEFHLALVQFQHFLIQTTKGPMLELKNTFPASPPVRRNFSRNMPTDPYSNRFSIASKPGASWSKAEQELIWLLRTLWEDGRTLFLTRLPFVLDELDRLVDGEPEASNCLSAMTADIIGVLSILCNCLTQLDLYQPWARGFEEFAFEKDEEIKEEFRRQMLPLSEISAVIDEKKMLPILALGNPSNKRFYYPANKRRTKANVEAMRQAEQNLDEFWTEVDKYLKAKCGSLESTALGRFLAEPRTLQRTPEWIEEPGTSTLKGKQKQKEPVQNPQVEVLYKPLTTLYFGAQATTEGAKTPVQATKAKTKTKGPKQGSVEEEPTQEIEEPQPRSSPIQVDARSLKVFRSLFFNPNVTSSPGEVSWTDFLHAMTSTKLFSAEKLYGSIWQFERLDEGNQSRIQFHEPHPHGKLSFVMARRNGRRLQRMFGWSGDMFLLREK